MVMVVSTFGIVEANAEQAVVGGHIGVALPMVTRGDGVTTTLQENFAIAFPMGITVLKNTRLPIDIGIALTVQRHHSIGVAFAVGTGIPLGRGFGMGSGIMYDATHSSWGGAVGINRVFGHLPGGQQLLGEVVVPIQLAKNDVGGRFMAITVATHIAVLF